jgi:hypothetical protein
MRAGKRARSGDGGHLAAAAVLALAAVLGACGSDDGAPLSPDANADARDAPSAEVDTAAPPAALGATCDDDRGCLSGICAAGICCSTPCEGSCHRCAISGHPGQCELLPAGAACGGALCTSFTTFQPARVCDGQGTCLPMPAVVCSPARCLDDACVSACTRDDECDPPASCQLGRCTGRDGGTGDASSDAADAAWSPG